MRRQWLGNLIPLGVALLVALVCFPLGFFGQAIVGIGAAWLGVSQWGFFENVKIERELRARLGSEGELIGFVYCRPPTALDAHAELGLMTILPDEIKVETEDESYLIRLADITNVDRQMNIHSLLGLGGWIALELETGRNFRFESRKYPTMYQSNRRTNELFAELRTLINEKAPA